MERNPLHFTKDKESTELLYDSKLKFLEKELSYLIDDEAVRLYLFLQKEIETTKKDKSKALENLSNKYQSLCSHPIYVCLNNNYDPNKPAEYDCMCLNCGTHTMMNNTQLEDLYKKHRLIAVQNEYIDINSGDEYFYYTFDKKFANARDYYLDLYNSVDIIAKQAMEQEIPVDDFICEKTFEHFVMAPLEKSSGKQLKKTK